MIRAHLLRWRPRPHAQRTESTPRVRPSGAASQLDPSHPSSRFSPTGPRVISLRRQRFHLGPRSGGTMMSLTTRRFILKGLAGAGAATAVSGFPFVNRLALGQQSLKLGVVVPMTGPMALEAQEMLAATQIAVEDVNADGGVMGRKVETVIRDSEFKPEVA